MSDPYGFRVTVDTSVTYTDEDGEERTIDFEGREFIEIEDPCAALRFYRAAMAQEEIRRSFGMEDQSSQYIVNEMKEACNDTHAEAREDVTEAEIPETEEPEAVPSETGTDEPPMGVETTESLDPPGEDAKTGENAVGVSKSERPPGESDGRPLSQQYRDPQNPMSDFDVVAVLRDQGASPEEQRDGLERVTRNEPPEGQPHPDHGRDRLTEPMTEADPVDVFGGRYVRTETDVTIPSRGFDVELTRTYRSGPDYFGPFGFNWDHSYNQYLRPLDDGDVAVWTGRLAEHVYSRRPDGSFEPPTGVARLLEHEPASGTDEERYVLTDRRGRTRVFSVPAGYPHGDRLPLVRIEDDAGNAHELSYDADGRLASVTDHAGRALAFHYGDCGLLEQVTDHTGRTWEYRHGPKAERLVEVRQPATDEHPDGPAVRYEYDRGHEHPALQHNVVRVVDENGDLVLENEYGADPTTDDFGRVVRQYVDGSLAEFSAERLQAVPETPEAANVPAWQVSVIDPGILTVYTFNYRGDLLDERFRLFRDESFRLVARTYRYDERGNLIERREPNGLGVETAYDAEADDPRAWANPVKQIIRAPPASGALDREVFSASYEDRYQRPRTITDEDDETTEFVYEYEVSGADHGGVRRIEHPDATLPDGSSQPGTETFEYDDYGRLVATETPAGHRHVYEYHTDGPGEGLLASETRDVGGAAVERNYEYDRWGTLARVTDGRGASVDLEHDELGRLVRRASPEVDGDRATVRFRHNPDGSVRRVEEPRGEYDDDDVADPYVAHEFAYDCLGRLTEARYGVNTAETRRYRYGYDGEGNLLSTEGPEGSVTESRYDERGRVLERTVAAGSANAATTEFVYDRNGNRVVVVDPSDRRTDVEYDPFDRVASVRYPGADGERTTVSYGYGPNDRVTDVTAEGVPEPGAPRTTLSSLSVQYDERGRPYERTVGDVTQVSWYDADDRVVKRIGPQGGETTFEFDGLDRVTGRVDPAGNARDVSYAGGHGPTVVEDVDVAPDGSTETFRRTIDRDARGRPTRITDPLGNTVGLEYDERSLAVTVELPDGRNVANGYSLDGNVVERTIAPGTADAATHRWSRDGLERVVTYVDPEGTPTEYEHTPHGQPASVTYDDGTERVWSYGNRTELEQVTRPDGTVVEYGYDAAGRVDGIAFAEGPTVESTPDLDFAYDGLDRPIRTAQDGLTLERSFDEFGRVRSESIGGDEVSLDYDDEAGTVHLTYPDGRVDRHDRDATGRLTAVTLQNVGSASLTGSLSAGDDLVTYEYVGTDRLARRTLANGTETTYEYDAGRRPTAIHHRDADGDSIVALQYAYDATGRRRVRRAEPGPLDSAVYEYDDFSRLVERAVGVSAGEPPTVESQADADGYIAGIDASSAQRREQFSLNAAGDRVERIVADPDGTRTDRFDVDAMHRIRTLTRTDDGATTTSRFDYSDDGRLLEDDRQEYVYDAMGRVIEIQDGSGETRASFEYDPAGRVRERTVDGSTERLVALGSRPLQAAADGGTPRRQYSYGSGPGGSVAESDGTTTWAHLDPRGSLVAASDESGHASQRYDYSAFGVPSVYAPDGSTSTTAATIAPRFAGHELLGDTSLYPTPNRLYDPITGRFTSRDPNGYRDSASPYPYAANDPVNNVDPTGGAVLAVLGIVAAGAAIGGLAELGRQGIEYARGRREEVDWGNVGIGAAAGGVLAPALVFAPELAVPLAGAGIYSGAKEISKDRWATGLYDIGFSVIPFGPKGGRAAMLGKGTLVGRARGLGPADPASIRANRVIGSELLPSTRTRATHFTTREGLRSIREEGILRESKGATGLEALSEGRHSGAWVTPGSARRMSPGQRLMIGRLKYRYRYYVEFEADPAEMKVPRGFKGLFGPVQRKIRGNVVLGGRNPEFGELSHWDPSVLSPLGARTGGLHTNLDAALDGVDVGVSEPSEDPVFESMGIADGSGPGRASGGGGTSDAGSGGSGKK